VGRVESKNVAKLAGRVGSRFYRVGTQNMDPRATMFLIHSMKRRAALQKMKPGTAPGYDKIHMKFLKNLGPKARTWLSKFFSRIMATHSIPKIWRKAKVTAVEKPDKHPSLAANYRPISLLSECYKLLERLALQRISPTVEGLITQSRPGWFPERSKHL